MGCLNNFQIDQQASFLILLIDSMESLFDKAFFKVKLMKFVVRLVNINQTCFFLKEKMFSVIRTDAFILRALTFFRSLIVLSFLVQKIL